MATKSYSPPVGMAHAMPHGFGPETRGERHRLFFALVPDDAVRDDIARVAAQLRSLHHPRGSAIARERYHVTLHFLGDCPQLRQDLVDGATKAAAKIAMPAFDLVFDAAMSFSSPTPPWVLRCPEPATPIRGLWRALGVALLGERLSSESGLGFTPHITVLRDADKPLPDCAIGPIRWRVREFVLIHSRLGPERRYTELGRWPLAGASSAAP